MIRRGFGLLKSAPRQACCILPCGRTAPLLLMPSTQPRLGQAGWTMARRGCGPIITPDITPPLCATPRATTSKLYAIRANPERFMVPDHSARRACDTAQWRGQRWDQRHPLCCICLTRIRPEPWRSVPMSFFFAQGFGCCIQSFPHRAVKGCIARDPFFRTNFRGGDVSE